VEQGRHLHIDEMFLQLSLRRISIQDLIHQQSRSSLHAGTCRTHHPLAVRVGPVMEDGARR
jgi:hypothetical protein